MGGHLGWMHKRLQALHLRTELDDQLLLDYHGLERLCETTSHGGLACLLSVSSHRWGFSAGRQRRCEAPPKRITCAHGSSQCTLGAKPWTREPSKGSLCTSAVAIGVPSITCFINR